MSLFRVIHISDFHYCVRPHRRNFFNAAYNFFGELPALTLRHLTSTRDLGFFPSSYSDEISELAAKFIFDLNEEFDLVVASGDIATIGTTRSIDAAYEFVDNAYGNAYLSSKLQPTLGGNVRRIFLLPGNHDRYRNLLGGTGAAYFDHVFKKYWSTDNYVTSRVLRKDGNTIAFISADFCLQSDDDASGLNRLGRGKAYEKIVDGMVAETARLREKYKNPVIIWVVHFPPVPSDDLKLLLIDHYILEGAAIGAHVSFFLAGHLHRNQVTKTQYGTPILTAGSLCSYDDDGNNWIHVLNLDVQGGELKSCERIDYRWDDVDQDFVVDAATRIPLWR